MFVILVGNILHQIITLKHISKQFMKKEEILYAWIVENVLALWPKKIDTQIHINK